MKKICFITSSPLTIKSFLMHHIEVLSKEFEVSIIANFEGNDMENFVHELPLTTVHSIPIHRSINIIQDLKALYKLKKYLKKNQFDAIHSVTPKAGLIAMLAGKWAGIPNRIHIFTGQVWHTQKGFFKKLLMFLDKVIVFASTKILVDGQSQRDYLIANNIINENNSAVLGKGSISGVDAKKFVSNENIRHQIRKELKIQENEVVFMFLGRLNLDKGLIDLAHAFKKLIDSKETTNYKLLLVGIDEENLLPPMKQIIGNDQLIIFTGPKSNPQDYLQAADVFCLPSYREGFGTSVIEASLINLPIICSDTYGLQETIIENKTGLRHKVGDVNDIYNKMKILAEDEQMRKQFGSNAGSYVRENFLAATISNEWLLFYKEMLH